MAKKKRDIPRFSKAMIETHCHLDYLKDRPIEETLEKAKEVGIEKVVTIAVEPGNLSRVFELAQKYPSVYGTQGIHPHEAKTWTKEVEALIRQNAPHDKIVAIGEIGLDFHYNNSPREEQIEAFNTQMTIASELDMPVVIHSRDADPETIEVLESKSPALKQKGVIHSFTSGKGLAERALELGFYLGFNGIITFNKAENVREIVRLCPLDKILIETDSPFLTPVPYRGRENAPFYLPFVAEKIAELKDVSVEEVIEVTTQNARNLFSL